MVSFADLTEVFSILCLAGALKTKHIDSGNKHISSHLPFISLSQLPPELDHLVLDSPGPANDNYSLANLNISRLGRNLKGHLSHDNNEKDNMGEMITCEKEGICVCMHVCEVASVVYDSLQSYGL